MKSIKLALALVAILMTAGTASARDFASIYKECGLGALLFPDDPIIAVVTNVTWDLGTTAVSSAVTTPGACKGGSVDMAQYIIDTHPQIEQDLSVGAGTHLSSMVSMMGCGDNTAVASSALRAEFSNVVADGYYEANDLEKSELLFNAAMDVSSQHCTI